MILHTRFGSTLTSKMIIGNKKKSIKCQSNRRKVLLMSCVPGIVLGSVITNAILGMFVRKIYFGLQLCIFLSNINIVF